MASYKIVESDLMFYGDVALLPYVVELEATNGAKQKLRIFDVFAKLNGDWVQVGTNTGPHPDQIARQMSDPAQLPPPIRKALLDTRDAVWRAYFANSRPDLETMLADELVAVGPDSDRIDNRDAVIAASQQFVQGGGKLVKLDFPSSEIQVYGNTAIIYSRYDVQTERGGQQHAMRGRVSETFVFRNKRWVNTAWQMTADAGTQ